MSQPKQPSPGDGVDESKPVPPIKNALRTGLRSARENALPGFILWVFAAAIVAGYWLFEPVHAALGALGRLKASSGYAYSAIATGIFGGFIPFLWRLARGGKRARETGIPLWNVPSWAAALFLTLFWAYNKP